MDTRPTILVVDDEALNIELISNIFCDKYEIKAAFDAKKAFMILQKINIDLILLDIGMPDIDGYEFAKMLKENDSTKDIPFIFLTSIEESNSIVKGFNLGAVDYITKPFNKAELKVRVQNHIKSYLLQKDLNDKNNFIQTILDTHPSMVLIANKNEILFSNKTFLDFFDCLNIEEFINRNKSITNTFVEIDLYFHCGKIKDDTNWLDYVMNLSEDKRIVSIIYQKSFTPKAFNISVVKYNEAEYIITFTDISETIIRQMQLENKNIKDNLTGAFNREYFDINHLSLIEEFHTNDMMCAVAVLDIDFFKKINDTYGHDIGDKTLKEFVKVIKAHSRGDDVLIRWGGEEFLIVLKVNQEKALEIVLEKYRKVIDNHSFADVENVTCSIGGSFYIDNENIEKTIKRADEKLYLAKRNGRNRVEV